MGIPEPAGATPAGSRRERLLAALLVALPVLWNLALLQGELRWGTWDLNDGVLHLTAIERMLEAPARGENPLDFWLSEWTLGYPFFRTYQPLPHAIAAAATAVLPGADAPAVFNVLRWLVLALWPLGLYAAARTLGLGRIPSACAALLSPFVSTDGYYGLEYGSYLWRGSGLYTQLFGMWFLPLSAAWTWRAVRTGAGHGWAALFLALSILSHLYYGWTALLLIPLAVFLPAAMEGPGARPLPRRAAAAGVLLLPAFAATAWFTVPMLLSSAHANHSRWEYPWKWDSFGALRTLRLLFTGGLFDSGRPAALTLLVLLGAFVVILPRVPSWRERPGERAGSRFSFTAFLATLLLFFGREAWGPVFDLLPGARDLPHHRMIGPVHLFGLLLAGIGMGALLLRVLALRTPVRSALAAGLAALFLGPLLKDRHDYIRQGDEWARGNEEAILREKADVDEVIRLLREDGAGRVYPGLAGGWGRDFKVGMTAFYAFLSRAHVDAVAFLYHSMALTSEVMVHFDEENPEDWDLFHVTHAVAPADRSLPGFLEPWKQIGRFRIWRAPPGRWFSPLRVERSFSGKKDAFYDESLAWMRGPGPATGEGLALLFPGQAWPGPAPGLGVLEDEERAGQEFRATVDNRGATVWMLKMTFHPGWRATVDGAPAGTLMVAPGFLGIRVPDGRHRIECRYEAGALKSALLPLGVLALVGSVAAGIFGARAAGRAEGAISRLLEAAGRAAASPWRRVPPTVRDLLLCALFGIAAGLPLLRNAMPGGHDVLEYLPRLVEFLENLRQGVLLPRWAPDLGSGQGEPLFLLSPPLFYYLGSAFHLLGLPHLLALNLACVLIAVLAAAGAFLLARDLAGGGMPGRYAGIAAAALYAWSPYLATDLYVRAAWAELTAFPWIPFALWGVLRAARGERAGIAIAAVATALLVLSHNAIFLLAAPLPVAGALLCAASARAGRPRALAVLAPAAAGVLGLLLPAYFLLPALAEMEHTKVHLLSEGYLAWRNHFVSPWQLLWSPWGFGLSIQGPRDGMAFLAGPLHLLAALLALLLTDRLARLSRPLRFWVPGLVLLGSFYLFLTTGASGFLWERLALLQYMAFPWRALLPATACLSVAGGLAASLLAGRRHGGAWLASAIALLALSSLGNARPEKYIPIREGDWTPREIARRGVSTTTRNEFQPRAAVEPAGWSEERARIIGGEGTAVPVGKSPESETLRVRAQGPVTVEVATLDFPGWRVLVQGRRVPHRAAEGTGRIVFDLPAGDQEVRLVYGRTPSEKIGLVLSGIGILALAALGARRSARAPRGSAPAAPESRPAS